MSGREEGYYGPSSSDLGCGALVAIAFVVASIALIGVLCFMSLHADAASEQDSSGGSVGKASDLAIDVTDQWAMHNAGLPTKADVLAWHMYGRWGFYEIRDGVQEVHIWHDLPGEPWVWDALYGLNPDNPAFKFKGETRYEDEA